METRAIKRNSPAGQRKTMPVRVAFLMVISMAVMLCVTVNYRSFGVMNAEVRENEQLATQIQSVTDENLQLQDEIHSLKSDSRVIQREAEKLGLTRKEEKVSVPTN